MILMKLLILCAYMYCGTSSSKGLSVNFRYFFQTNTVRKGGGGLICVRMMYTEKNIDVLLAACRALRLRYMYLQHILSCPSKQD